MICFYENFSTIFDVNLLDVEEGLIVEYLNSLKNQQLFVLKIRQRIRSEIKLNLTEQEIQNFVVNRLVKFHSFETFIDQNLKKIFFAMSNYHGQSNNSTKISSNLKDDESFKKYKE